MSYPAPKVRCERAVVNVAIIDSGGANIASVQFALQRLGAHTVFTDDPEVIGTADRVILPGVGAARSAMRHLSSNGLIECIRALKQPVLGICLGMQLLFERSTEGHVACLGIIPAQLERFPESSGMRIPHMGWNAIDQNKEDPLFHGMDQKAWCYFVHSYYAPLGDWTLASAHHGVAFSALVRQGNFAGAQFHPERSASAGAQLLKNFLELS